MYAAETGTDESPCVSETQERTCYNGVLVRGVVIMVLSSVRETTYCQMDENINLVGVANQEGVYLHWTILEEDQTVDIYKKVNDTTLSLIAQNISTTEGSIGSGELVPLE